MMVGTSPSLTALQNGGYLVAYQSPQGYLMLAGGTKGIYNSQALMMPGSSPAVTQVSGGIEVIYVTPSGEVSLFNDNSP